MKYLFVHQNYPAQFLHIVRHLLAQGEHDVVFICEPNANVMPGVRRITYRAQKRPEGHQINNDAKDFALAMARATEVARAANEVKKLGFRPDIIIGHHGWGELLNLCDVWPDVPLLGYHEFYYALAGQDVGFDPEFPTDIRGHANIRAKNAVNLLALTNPGFGQTPTQFQLSTYPEWARPSINLLSEGVNTDKCRPITGNRTIKIADIEIGAKDKLVSFVARDLEPYRGFHQIMRALPAVLRARPDAKVIMVGGDGVSYGARLANTTWREHMLAELGSTLDASRVYFPGKLDYENYLHLLQRSDAHVYFTYPFVLSWSLREALSCGCAVIASDTAPVREFITSGDTGLLTPFFDAGALADRILETLEGGPKVLQRRANARSWAEKNLDMEDYIGRYEALISNLTGLPIQRKAPLASPSARRPDSPPPALTKLVPYTKSDTKLAIAKPALAKAKAITPEPPAVKAKAVAPQPPVSKPGPAKASSAKAVVPQPQVAKVVSKPSAVKPLVAKPTAVKAVVAKPLGGKPIAVKSASQKSPSTKFPPPKPAPVRAKPRAGR